jgi:hypothetical protein
MGGSYMYDQIGDIALAAAGLALTIFAITWHKHLTGRQVVDIVAEKLGIALKTDAFGLVVLLGCLMVITGIFFRYQQYESKTKELETNKKALEQLTQELKRYDVGMFLIFPDDNKPDQENGKYIFKGYTQKKGERVRQLNDTAKAVSALGTILVSFENVNSGDILYVEIEEGSKKWQSDSIIIPTTQLRMFASRKTQQ